MNVRKIGVAVSAALVTAALAGTASAAPVSKQNGQSALQPFSSVCSPLPTYAYCATDPTLYSTAAGKIDAVQAKAGRYNMGFTFTGLQAGSTYRVWENLNGAFTMLGDVVADDYGRATFAWQYFAQAGDALGFDLNIDPTDGYGTTVVTSYWSGATLTSCGDEGLVGVCG